LKKQKHITHATLNPQCRRVREHVYQLLDSRLSPPKKRSLRRHLEECPKCFSRFEFSRILRKAIQHKVLEERCPSTLLLRVRNTLASYTSSPQKKPGQT